MSTAAAIIAGGRATRMGVPDGGAGHDRSAGGDEVVKALLLVEGRRIIDRQLELLRAAFDEVLIVANTSAPFGGLGARVVPDRHRGGVGPLAGLDAALAALPASASSVVCVAADMPFLCAPILELLRDLDRGAPALVPRVDGRPEPLLARYGRSCAELITEQLARGDHALQALLARLPVTWIDETRLRALDPDLRCLVNVNTPEQLASLGARDAAASRG
jgi:molybdopterin-guanine dinucleotide biosynthesis protein A